MKIVAVTSCITGIAHTYMAAEALEQAAKKAGYEISVETQGSAGSTPLPQATIDAADVVIFATDLEVKDKNRFNGKPFLQIGVSKALADAEAVVASAVASISSAPLVGGSAGPRLSTKVVANERTATRIRKWLMTGVSYMIPFVAAGGILIALAFLLGGYEIALGTNKADALAAANLGDAKYWAALCLTIGGTAFGFLLPVLSGFIAFAIADRPGLVPGFVGGAVAGAVGAGFLGALITGFLGGFVALGLSRLKVPNWLKPVMPVVLIPLVASFVTGGLMFIVLGAPIKALMDALTAGLTQLADSGNLPLVGLVLGLMMAFDMGGPVNKVAYLFATGLLATQLANTNPTDPSFVIMAMVMAAGMTPPLGLALATVIRKHLFSNAERQNGKAAWLLGAFFITEGAIPFAAADPLRVIPSIMIGSGFTGALVGIFNIGLRAPHGGLVVFPLVSNPVMYIVAVAIGTVVTALLVLVAKNIKKNPETSDEALEAAIA